MTPLDKPHERLLDRHRAQVENQEYLEVLDSAASGLINEATWIFARCWESAATALTDEVILVLYRHMIEMADAMHILLLRSASVPARLPLRSLFEVLLYIEHLLDTDTENRARAYVVGSYLWGLRWARRMEKGSQARKQFVKEVGSDRLVTPPMIAGWTVDPQEIQQTEAHLKSPEFAPIYEKFQQFKKDRKRWPRWYEGLTPKISNLNALALRLGRGAQYVLYDHWSRAMHPDLLAVHIERESDASGKGYLRELRDGTDISQIAHGLAWFLKDGTKALLERYRPGEAIRFETTFSEQLWPLFRQLGETEITRINTLS